MEPPPPPSLSQKRIEYFSHTDDMIQHPQKLATMEIWIFWTGKRNLERYLEQNKISFQNILLVIILKMVLKILNNLSENMQIYVKLIFTSYIQAILCGQ